MFFDRCRPRKRMAQPGVVEGAVEGAQPRERMVPLFPELRLAVKEWGSADSGRKLLAGHGWMDAASTWDLVAPALAAEGWHVLAVDLPGHGRSDWKPSSASYFSLDYAASLLHLADAVWGCDAPFVVMGHSMSAGLASVLAGSFPDRVRACVMVDGVGLSLRKPEEAVAHFRDGFGLLRASARQTDRQTGTSASSVQHGQAAKAGGTYPTLDAAVDARLATVSRYPGEQTMSRNAATRLVQRALVEVEGGWRFRHDKRIVGPPLLSPAEEHARAFLSAIRCPVLIVRATQGWPWPHDVVEGRLAVLRAACGDGAGGSRLTLLHLPGGHHLHVDPDTAESVSEAVRDFLRGVHM